MNITRRRVLGVLAGAAAAIGVPSVWLNRMKTYSGPVSDHFDGLRSYDPDGVPPKSLGEVLRWQFGGRRQRAAHLAHRGIDILLGQRTAPRQAIENATKPFRQIVEQCRCPPSCVRTPFQTVLRPRAHRAVGRWPPASWAGRRVEKNVFPRKWAG